MSLCLKIFLVAVLRYLLGRCAQLTEYVFGLMSLELYTRYEYQIAGDEMPQHNVYRVDIAAGRLG